jgi:hypothetical protein
MKKLAAPRPLMAGEYLKMNESVLHVTQPAEAGTQFFSCPGGSRLALGELRTAPEVYKT